MGSFIGRAIGYFTLIVVCIFGYWIYSAFFAEETYNYFSMENLKNALWASGGGGILFAAGSGKKQQAEQHSEDEPETRGKRGSSATAKAGFLMGAAALARTSKPSRIPQATSRGGNRNLSCHNVRGDKWIITFETLHPSTGWIADKREINPSTSGFGTWGGQIDIRWS